MQGNTELSRTLLEAIADLVAKKLQKEICSSHLTCPPPQALRHHLVPKPLQLWGIRLQLATEEKAADWAPSILLPMANRKNVAKGDE